MTSTLHKRMQRQEQQVFVRPMQQGRLPAPVDLWAAQQTIANRLNSALPLWDQSPAAYQSRDPSRFPSHAPAGAALQSGAAHSQMLFQDYLLRNRIREGEMMQPLPSDAGKRTSFPLHRYRPVNAVAVKMDLTAQSENHPTVQQLQQQNDSELDDTSSRVLMLVLLGSGMAVLLYALS